ncbi:hypothetical protein [Haladaptatus sp. R4]|uniref:hypothetical protein n=1 Tax=Haladaptatus sp. R4 TaxID=1679489 RepID=UPI000ADEB8A3|nr:hypothetical protein [Haladaptatus sp. R4]
MTEEEDLNDSDLDSASDDCRNEPKSDESKDSIAASSSELMETLDMIDTSTIAAMMGELDSLRALPLSTKAAMIGKSDALKASNLSTTAAMLRKLDSLETSKLISSRTATQAVALSVEHSGLFPMHRAFQEATKSINQLGKYPVSNTFQEVAQSINYLDSFPTQNVFQEITRSTNNSGLFLNQNALNTASLAVAPINHSLKMSALNQFINHQPLYSQSKLYKSAIASLSAINSTSIQNDLSLISSKTKYNTFNENIENGQPKTEIDEIRPPELRIHDNLIWDDGGWYRKRCSKISITVVDYIFWKAKEANELSDASNNEIVSGMIALTLILTYILTQDLFSSVTLASLSSTSKMMMEAADDRSERKDLDEKFSR